MLPEDEMKLKELLEQYSPKLVLNKLYLASLDAADEASDNGLKDKSKELSQFSAALENVISGKPYLV